MQADFYLITGARYREQPLLVVCKLVQKVLAADLHGVILARDAAQAEELDDLLWAFDEDAFLPHQIVGNEDDADVPMLIVPPGAEVPARAIVINLRDDAYAGAAERVLEVVPAEPARRASSRARWRAYQAQGCDLRKHDI